LSPNYRHTDASGKMLPPHEKYIPQLIRHGVDGIGIVQHAANIGYLASRATHRLLAGNWICQQNKFARVTICQRICTLKSASVQQGDKPSARLAICSTSDPLQQCSYIVLFLHTQLRQSTGAGTYLNKRYVPTLHRGCFTRYEACQPSTERLQTSK
jgi:hypothetical protein